MKFSTRTTYGLRAIIYLIKKDRQDSVSLASIARAEDISLKYLERLFARMKKAGLVKAVKGAAGGYQLAAAPETINMFDVINSLEGEMNLFHCSHGQGKVYCSKTCDCQANAALAKLQKSINLTLRETKLSQLL